MIGLFVWIYKVDVEGLRGGCYGQYNFLFGYR